MCMYYVCVCVCNETCVRVVDPKSLLKLNGCVYQRMLLLLYNAYYTRLCTRITLRSDLLPFSIRYSVIHHFYAHTCCIIYIYIYI